MRQRVSSEHEQIITTQKRNTNIMPQTTKDEIKKKCFTASTAATAAASGPPGRHNRHRHHRGRTRRRTLAKKAR
jgi:hypothetical protein